MSQCRLQGHCLSWKLERSLRLLQHNRPRRPPYSMPQIHTILQPDLRNIFNHHRFRRRVPSECQTMTPSHPHVIVFPFGDLWDRRKKRLCSHPHPHQLSSRLRLKKPRLFPNRRKEKNRKPTQKMSTTIRDASLTTARRRQIALYGWRYGVGLYANPTTEKSEQAPSNAQGGGPSGDVTLNVRVGAQLMGQTAGACPCGNALLAGYSKSSPGCGGANNP